MTPCIITLQFASDTKFGRAPARTGWQSTKWTTMSSNSYRTIRCRMWPRGSYHHAANVCWGHYCASCRTCSRLVHTSTRIQLYFVFIRIRSKERTRLVVLCDCFQMHTHQEDMFQVEYVLFGLRCDWYEWIPKDTISFLRCMRTKMNLQFVWRLSIARKVQDSGRSTKLFCTIYLFVPNFKYQWSGRRWRQLRYHNDTH